MSNINTNINTLTFAPPATKQADEKITLLRIKPNWDQTRNKIDALWHGGPMTGTVGAIVGAGAAGKSYFALQAAISVAAGVNADSLNLGVTKKGQVFYFALEDPAEILENRILDICASFNSSVKKTIDENFYLISALAESAFNFSNNKFTEMLANSCDGARLIVIDTLNRSHNFEENSNGEMSQLIKKLEFVAKQTGATVLFLHHVAKGAGIDQTAARGASALIDNARWAAVLRSVTEEESDELFVGSDENPVGAEQAWRYVRYRVNKSNYVSAGDDGEKWLERGEHGVLKLAQAVLVSRKNQRENMKNGRQERKINNRAKV